jgi:hypothetical protein
VKKESQSSLILKRHLINKAFGLSPIDFPFVVFLKVPICGRELFGAEKTSMGGKRRGMG